METYIKEKKFNVRRIPYFLSHYLNLIFLLICLFVAFILTKFSTVHEIQSNNRTEPFTEEPFYFVQMSDTHFTQKNPSKVENLQKIFKNISKKIDPPLVIISGDITDGTENSSKIQKYESNHQNWVLYNISRYQSGLIKKGRVLLEYPGNHDYFGISDDDSPINYYKQFALNNELRNTGTNYTIETNVGKINFISFTGLHFPSPTGPFGSFPVLLQSDVDKLQNSYMDDATNIIISHFPVKSLWDRPASNGESFESIIRKTDIYLAGHTHPKTFSTYHVDDTLTIACTSTCYEQTAGIITIEKGAIIYNEFNPFDNNTIAISYPVPLKQVSKYQVFNENNFPVRIIGFSKKELNLTLVIDGKKIGKIPMVKLIKENVKLYSLNVTVKDGKHKLKIEGDSTKEIEFYVGQKSPIFVEIIPNTNSKDFLVAFAFVFLIITVLKLIPMWIPFKKELDEFENYMFYCGSDSIPICKQIFVGPLYIWNRLRKVPIYVYIFIIILSLAILGVPYAETKIESYLAIVWLWGYSANGDIYFDAHSYGIMICYYLLWVLPVINICGIYFESVKHCLLQKVEFGINSLAMLIATVAWVIVCLFYGGVFSVFTSFFTYLQFVTYIFLISTFIINWNRTQEQIKPELTA